MPRIPGLLERIQQPLYDTQIVEPQKTEYKFFQVPYDSEKRLFNSVFFDYEALKTADDQVVSCPLCKDRLIEGFKTITSSVMAAIHQCTGCSTFYHRNCANEMHGCATLGCEKKGQPIPPPVKKQNKTRFQTNMQQGGSLPYPKNFEIHGIDLSFDKTADQYDVNLFKEHAFFELFIGTKPYLEIPVVTLERSMHRGCYVLAEPIDLIPQRNFRTTVFYNGPKKINAPFQMRCALHGFFKREVH